ncbi:MAG: hypothetical protein K2J67_06410, partial [Lachnospiraceae bacterium]|nr:hypothetical protein [Lachnospiraceae bacterium]
MKHYFKYYTSSIRMKLILAMVCILGLTIVTFCVMNYAFLPHFYQLKKVSTLRDSYAQVERIVAGNQNDQNQDTSSEWMSKNTLALEKLEEDRATSIYIFQLTNYLGNIFCSFNYPSENELAEEQSQIIEDMIREYVPGVNLG